MDTPLTSRPLSTEIPQIRSLEHEGHPTNGVYCIRQICTTCLNTNEQLVSETAIGIPLYKKHARVRRLCPTCAMLMRPEGDAHENCLQALLSLSLAEHSSSHPGQSRVFCWSLPPALRLLQVCIQSHGTEVLEVLRSGRNVSLSGASQSCSLKRCRDISGTFQSLVVLKRVLVFSGMARAGSPTARCVHEREMYHMYEVGTR